MSLFQSFRTYLRARQITIQSESNEQRIAFERGGLNYVFVSDLRDPLYFRIILPRIEHVENENMFLLKLINHITLTFKAGKALLIENDVWLTFEQFVDNADVDHYSIFDRGFSILSEMLEEYKEQPRNNQPKDGDETGLESGEET